jgi:hypothetical protein
MQDGLLGGDFSYQRREIHIQISYRTPKLINIVKTKNLWRQRSRWKIVVHEAFFEKMPPTRGMRAYEKTCVGLLPPLLR